MMNSANGKQQIVLAIAVAAVVSAITMTAAHSQAGGTIVEATSTAPAQAKMTDAEVRKVDLDARKVTLKHGEIKYLDMPAMTMTFNVRDVALIDKLTAGDRIRFHAEKDKGSYWVTAVERLR